MAKHLSNKYTRRGQLERLLTKAFKKNSGMIRVAHRGELVALTIHKASVLLEPGEAEKVAMALADAIDAARDELMERAEREKKEREAAGKAPEPNAVPPAESAPVATGDTP